MNNYVNIINSESAKNLDIIVFPELTLSVRNHKVPDPELKVIPCLSDEYSVQLHNISCAAREMKTYVLINVKEYVECTTEMIEEDLCNPKSNLNYYQYNTNVVFDRNGAVISRYRKFHLFGELYTDAPLQPEISIFETDFNVKFGHFTCFDLIFEEPTLSLMNNNVTDILFPSLWYSELPFLTAVQIQFYWAYRFNVNLLAAGANTPSVGSTGSGIYNGRNGALVHGMHFEDETKLYVAEVPKINSYEGSISLGKIRPHLFRSSDKDNLFMLRDFLGLYNSILLDYNRTTLTEEICYYSNCCTATIDWNIQENVLGIDSNIFYRYRLGIFNGVRTFSGYATGGIIACAIYACTNETIESCGTQFNSTTEETKYSVIFNSISIEAKLESGSGIYFLPNTLDNYLLPLPVTSIKYEESSDYKDLFGYFRIFIVVVY